MMDPSEVVELITAVDNHLWGDAEVLSRVKLGLEASKANAVNLNDKELANYVWCLEKAIDAETTYIDAFGQLKEGEYYGAWMSFDRVENLEKHLAHHDNGLYQIPAMQFIFTSSRRFQSLFPYRLFISPAFLYKKMECSICHSPISIQEPCGHIPGEIYAGEMCYRIINEVELLEISVVDNPVQKYSVLFLSDEKEGRTDHYNYSVLEYLMKGLGHPFHGWSYEKTETRHPHHYYRHTSQSDSCPCGSGRSYLECCLKYEGVLRPHINIAFEYPPPNDLPRIIYPESVGGG